MRFDWFLKEACPPLELDWRKYRRRAARHRIDKRIRELGLSGYAAYLERLRADPAEAAGLAERMRITVSRFFRERERWESLDGIVLPELLQNKGSQEPLRVWSVGCCGGEEPYTLAMLWLERFATRDSQPPVEILGTDIDAASLARARRGVYAPGSVREVSAPLLHRYFHRQNHSWHVDQRVKNLVQLAEQDLEHDPLPREMDLVCCRYLVFTYYRRQRRLAAAERLRQALRPGGALMIARKEDLGNAAVLFEPWPGAAGVFRKK